MKKIVAISYIISVLTVVIYSCSNNIFTRVVPIVSQSTNSTQTNNTQSISTPLITTEGITTTPLSTLSSKNAEALFITLLKTNGNCNLPCIWGLTPDINNIEDVKSFMLRFSNLNLSTGIKSEINFRSNEGSLYFTYRADDWDNFISLRYHGVNQIETLFLEGEGLEAPLLSNPSTLGRLMSNYSLSQILLKYGKPSEALIYVYPNELDRPYADWNPFVLLLIYSDKRFYVNYVLNKETKGVDYLGCPGKISDFSLAAWSANKYNSYLDVAREDPDRWGINDEISEFFVSIESATNFSLNEFYDKFKNPSEAGCITTPQNIWSNLKQSSPTPMP